MPYSHTDLTVRHLSAEDMNALKEPLLDVYAKCYADLIAKPFFAPERHWERLEGYASRNGFALVIGSVGTEVVGCALGFTLPAETGWWKGLKTEVDPADVVETGTRTFALNELMVAPGHTNKGHGRALHDALLADRSEQRATLLVRPDNIPARPAYLRWGWRKLGEIQPFDDAPRYDAMVLDLK
ncbi:MAG: GNAT family N-acetyltransferase [Actinocatenispora sp.]